jgi:tight adherence protein B
MTPAILAILLLIVLVGAGMAAAIILGNRSARRQRALSVIRGKTPERLEKKDARGEQNRRRAEIARKLKEGGDSAEKGKKKLSRKAWLEQAGLSWSPLKYWIFSLVTCAVFTGLMKILGLPKPALFFLAVFGFLGLPRMIVNRRIKRRRKKFLEEFADALEAMVRLLKAGMPVTEAILMASREFEGPVGEEMARVYDSQKVGIPLPEAALEAARRMPITEMQMFATGLAIQAQTGASLSEVLLNLAKVIRARFRLRRKVQALSSEAKASAMIIGSLPFLIGLGLFFINRDYMGYLLHTPIGQAMMAGAAVWMCLGIFVMKIMINFKI